jgi:hypothetical protein
VRRIVLLAVLLALLAVPALTQTPAPSVSWTVAVSGPAPATVTIDVTVDAAGGTVAAVECFNGQTAIGVDDEAPYRIAWDAVPAGPYTPHCTAPVRPATTMVTGTPTPIVIAEPENYSAYPLIPNWGAVAAGYVGCVRIPAGPNGVMNYSGYGLTQTGPDTFMVLKESVALGGFPAMEIKLPATIAPSATVPGCPAATIVQAPTEIVEGKFTQLSDPSTTLFAGHVRLWGALAIGDQLCFVMGIFYDANNSGKRSAFCRSTNLAARGTVSNAMHLGTGTHKVTIGNSTFVDEKACYACGYLNWIPQEWRAVFGADAAAGAGGQSITFRMSQGPTMTFFNTADLIKREPNVPAQFLLNYPFENYAVGDNMLGIWPSSALPAPTAWFPEYEANGWTPKYNADGSIKLAMPLKPLSRQYGVLYNGTTRLNGFAWGNKSRTIMFIAAMGIGEWCYKDCPTHPVRPTTTRPDGTTILGGPHAEPDTYRVWFYDALDILKVKQGQMKPWEVRPYHVENITLPGARQVQFSIRGMAVDPATNRLYLTQYVDRLTTGGGYVDSPAVIHVYQLK